VWESNDFGHDDVSIDGKRTAGKRSDVTNG
jgi:hypothetical protein